jgi:membrane-bound serine protease (ClpP class)
MICRPSPGAATGRQSAGWREKTHFDLTAPSGNIASKVPVSPSAVAPITLEAEKMSRTRIARKPAVTPSVTAAVVLLLLTGPVRPTTAQVAASDSTASVVVVGTVDGAIGPATRDYIRRLIANAEELDAACAVIQMDTPGGLSASMRDIIQDILASTVPVVVYVSPSGARAASAGALISLAAHVAAMAPGTNIGAAHPVSIGGGGGEKDETMEEKVTSDAAAYARSLAAQRGRNVEWAEKIVRESISSTAQEAVDEGVVDLVATDLADLLDKLDGRKVDVSGRTVTLATAAASVVTVDLSWRERFLARISDPNVAYLLMLLGVFGIIFELQNPGAIFPGVIGVISILLATFALQILPVNYVGLALIVIAIVLFLLETQVPSAGLLTIGGVISMFIGSIMLIDSPLPFMRVSLKVIIPAVIFTAAFFVFAVGLGLRAQKRKVSTGVKGLTGETGIAKSDVHASGSVFVHGEYWNAYSDEKIAAGSRVEVVAVEGMQIKVRAADRKEVS